MSRPTDRYSIARARYTTTVGGAMVYHGSDREEAIREWNRQTFLTVCKPGDGIALQQWDDAGDMIRSANLLHLTPETNQIYLHPTA